jgi:hypothetical protein
MVRGKQVNNKGFSTIVDTQRRVGKRDLFPSSVDSRQLTNTLIKNTPMVSGTFTIANNVTITITATVSLDKNSDAIIGVLPFMIALFETSNTTGNLIPFGADIASGDYTVSGPMAMPSLSPIGTDGNNVVYKTSITNNTGSTQTILYYIQSRFISVLGGNVS